MRSVCSSATLSFLIVLSVKVSQKLLTFSIMILFSLRCSPSEITDSFIKQTSTYLMRFFRVSIEFDYIFLTQLSTDEKKLSLSRLDDFDQSVFLPVHLNLAPESLFSCPMSCCIYKPYKPYIPLFPLSRP